ncbi:MAG: hypothetical protein H6905_02590 [Hyphomicrobiales bacterium]|nr:hypothetical protein [Hyphomicrobiales bacterium]
MASVSWPLILPQYVLASGYSETPPKNHIRTEMAAGPAKVRRRTTANVRTIACKVRLSHAQQAALDQFYLIDTLSGTLPFDWLHPVSRVPAEMRFIEAPSYAASQNSLHLIASLKLEILP